MKALYTMCISPNSTKIICKKCGGTMKSKQCNTRFVLDAERLFKYTCKKCGNTIYKTEEI